MQNDGSLVLEILILFILIGVNAFFSASEIAIISLNDKKIKKMADEGHKKAILLNNLISEPSKFFATLQVGVTLSGLLASAFAAESFAARLVEVAKTLNLPIQESALKMVSVAIITVILSYITLVFGELIPKRVGMQKSEAISMFAIKPLSVLLKVANPFVRFLTFSTNSVIKLFGGNPNDTEENVTEEEIRMLVDLGKEKGVIHETEKEMIDNILEFDDTEVSEVMTHRKDIVALHVDSDLKDVLKVVSVQKFTRIPVYEENIDHIIGLLHIKDLFKFIEEEKAEDFNLREILRHPSYVHSRAKIDDVFKELQKNKMQMAVIIDEYGGTDGIATVEDLLEEIVGNIYDEYDDEESEFEKIDENTFVFKGIMSLDEVSKVLEIKLPVDDYDTLSGFIIGQLSRIPGEDEKPEIEFDGAVFKVEEVMDKRIIKVSVCKA